MADPKGTFYQFIRIWAYFAPMDEHRTVPRNRVLKAGTIEFGGGVVNCMARNLSVSGAALDVASPAGIPDHFTLVFPADGLRLPCHVVWRNEKRIGVAFD